MAKTISVNGRSYEVEVPGDTPLLWVLREELGLNGAKYACGIGYCGACNVLIGGVPIPSCMVPLDNLAGRDVVTIEGLAAEGMHPVQKAWIEEEVSQCGYCQPGMIVNAVALLRRSPKPSDAEIDAAMTNICRCGAYPRVRRAIKKVSAA